jgi:hypothetical protein
MLSLPASQTWWWNKAELGNHSRVQTYVNEKFEANIVSKPKLHEMLQDAIKQFQSHMEANRNELLVQVKTALSTSDVPISIRLSDEAFERFSKEVVEKTEATIQGFGSQSLSVMVLSNVGGEAAGYASTQLVTIGGGYLIGLFATSGGVTLGTAASGGAAGTTFIPGVGTVIGVGVGIVVGVIVDWWMTEKFRAEVAENCNKFLNELEQFTISGPKSNEPKSDSKSWEGFDKVLRNACDISSESLRNALHQSLESQI